MKLLKNKPKISKHDLGKIDSQLKEQKKCPFCANQTQEIKKCAESHNVKNNLKSVTWHIIKCSDCRSRVKLMVKCKQNNHR